MNLEITDPQFKEKTKALDALYNVIDPELYVNIVDLGLVYDIIFGADKELKVEMTLSTPHCPMGESIMNAVMNTLEDQFPGFDISVDLVWDPPWDISKVSEEGLNQLGI